MVVLPLVSLHVVWVILVSNVPRMGIGSRNFGVLSISVYVAALQVFHALGYPCDIIVVAPISPHVWSCICIAFGFLSMGSVYQFFAKFSVHVSSISAIAVA